MPAPISLNEARRVVYDELRGTAGETPQEDRVGIEAEVFAMEVHPGGTVGSRASLYGSAGALAIAHGLGWGRPGERSGNPMIDLGDLGELTFEPGAQIEHATRPRRSVSGAIDDVQRVRAMLALSAAEQERRLVACGSDLWHYADDIPQFLPGPRYKAMADYFITKGRSGPEMMRNTASVQINLDANTHLSDRWLTANLLAPLLTATFSTSATPHAASRRALTWQRLDPTRTGFPPLTDDPIEGITEWALAADLMLMWDGSTAQPMPPGLSLSAWIEGGGLARAPTAEDVRYHLTTLFPEVRLRRGVLEIRGVDSLPARWLPAPVILTAGAVYDSFAQAAIREALEPHRTELDDLWCRAARSGLSDPGLAQLAARVWPLAYEGARRLHPSPHPEHLATAVTFLESFTFQGRTPTSDEGDLAAHLVRCLEPVPPAPPTALVGSTHQKGSP